MLSLWGGAALETGVEVLAGYFPTIVWTCPSNTLTAIPHTKLLITKLAASLHAVAVLHRSCCICRQLEQQRWYTQSIVQALATCFAPSYYSYLNLSTSPAVVTCLAFWLLPRSFALQSHVTQAYACLWFSVWWWGGVTKSMQKGGGSSWDSCSSQYDIVHPTCNTNNVTLHAVEPLNKGH